MRRMIGHAHEGKPGDSAGASAIPGGAVLAALGLLFGWLVSLELRHGAAGGAVAEVATRAESPAAFWLIVAVQAFAALTLVAAGLRTAGMPLPAAPRPLVIAALALGVLLGGWMTVEFAMKVLGLTRDLRGDPGLAIFIRIAGLAMLGVLAYLIWEFGLSEIIGRAHPGDGDEA